MASFSSAISQAGRRRREEAKKQYSRGVSETAKFSTGGGVTQSMYGVLQEMQGQAADSMEKFNTAAIKANLPSVDLTGKTLPPAPAVPPELGPPPPPPGSNLPLILGIGAAVVVLIAILMRPPPAYY